MNQEFIQKLRYAYSEQQDPYPLPLLLKDSLQLVSDFFSNNTSNKLCLVFPKKEFSAHWLALNFAFGQVSTEFKENKSEIFEGYKIYNAGQKLLLNNSAVVEWIKGDEKEIFFKTKANESRTSPWADTKGDIITLRTSRIDSLRPAPFSRTTLSARKRVYENLPPQSTAPVDTLLDISSKGNFIFLKKPVCLISKIKNVEESLGNIYLNKLPLSRYFQMGKIDDAGTTDVNCPLLIAGNLLNLSLYAVANDPSLIIIDGMTAIQERGTDFSDIDVKNIKTILITDLSEIDSFEHIGAFGFEFFNFTKDDLIPETPYSHSPFYQLNKKLDNYLSFRLSREIIRNEELETLIRKIHSIEKDDSNNDLVVLKFSLIQLINIVTGVSHILTLGEISQYHAKLDRIKELFGQTKNWLGDSRTPIEESISILTTLIEKLALMPSEKCDRLKLLIDKNHYDYIICPTEEEAIATKYFVDKLAISNKPTVISAVSINDNLLSERALASILTGWGKSGHVNKILSSFTFSQITILFYQFENRYFNSLQRWNKKNSDIITSTVNRRGTHLNAEREKSKGFSDFFSPEDTLYTSDEGVVNISEFEQYLNSAQYSKYLIKGSNVDSVKAKRIDFEGDCFIYTTETHKFLVINELIRKQGKKAKLYTKKVEALISGDVIAQINTDRDILADLVERNANPEDLASVKQWANLWKNLLKDYYTSTGGDIKTIVDGLRSCHCTKHPITIKTWIQDDSRIGPDDNSDLISIALLTGSNLLNDNIDKVREAIKKMTGWRMRAADIISNKIKTQLPGLADHSIIGTKIQVEGLGSVNILQVSEIQYNWETIDSRYVNRILQKEIT